MEYPRPETILLPTEMHSFFYNKLVFLLNENDVWKQVAETFGIFSEYDIQVLKQHRRPAEQLLSELGTRLCSVEALCEVLKACQLYNILMIFKEHEPTCILEEPHGCSDNNTCMVERNRDLRLNCKATGLPPPTYQWFHENEELVGKSEPLLVVHNFDLQNEGEYHCLVSQEGYDSISSNTVMVLLAPEPPIITKQPSPCEVCPIGSRITLLVTAKGHPALSYQWFKENQQLDGQTGSQLVLNIKEENQDGNYKCYIRNTAGEVWSHPCRVTLYLSPRPEPSAKLALLIANQLYDNLNRLFTPENDVKTMADLLQDLGFAVIALQNLNLVEMRNAIQMFSKLLPKDAYVVFYFAGHGFEIRDKFMLPVDAPGPEDYLQTNALCERELLRSILNSSPKLLLQLLDMCLKPPDPMNKKIFHENSDLFEYEANNHLIQGYATTSYLGAYETTSDTNGLYVKHLKEYLSKEKDLPILKILENVAKDIALVCPMQMPYFGTNVTMDYRLADHCDDNMSARVKIEALSVLPKECVLSFNETNVKSKVTCSPYLGVFLNTLQVRFTNLQEYRLSCETVGEELSFDLTRIGEDVIIRIKNIQRLNSSKTLTLSLSQKNEELVDCAVWDLAKPMIAVADLWWVPKRKEGKSEDRQKVC